MTLSCRVLFLLAPSCLLLAPGSHALETVAVAAVELAPGPGEAVRDEAAFEEGLEKVRKLMGSGKWAAARKELVALVSEHREAHYVLTRRADLVDDLRRCLFNEQYDAPELEDLISGELVSYKESSGNVKLVYEMDQLDDFIVDDDEEATIYHPLIFDGAFFVEIEFSRYEIRDFPGVVIIASEVPVRAEFGMREEGGGNQRTYQPAIIYMPEKDESTWSVAAEEENPPVRSGEEVKLKFAVKSGSVALYANGRKYLSAGRKKGEYGQLGLFGLRPQTVKKITIQGDAQPTWFEMLRDDASQGNRLEFEKEFDPSEHFPAWLMHSSPETGTSKPVSLPYPGEARSSQDKLFADVEAALKEDDSAEARQILQRLGPTHTDAFRAFVRALVAYREGNFAQAAEQGGVAHGEDPAHVGTRLLLAKALRADGLSDRAIELLEALWKEHPTDGEVATELARTLLWDGAGERARQIVADAISRGVHPIELEDIQSLITRVERGPAWTKRYEYETRNYRVYSDISDAICFEVAQYLEKSLMRFQRDLRRTSKGGDKKYTAYVFSGEAGYLLYGVGLSSWLENTLGAYYSSLEQLVIWNYPKRENMFLTVRHEGFHQYFDRLLEHRPPRWLNEGLAEYYEMIELVDGTWNQGIPNEHHLRVLDAREPLPLEEFITDDTFFDDVGRSYAQGWAFVHFLLNGEDKGTIFDDLIDAMVAGADKEEALQKAFAGVDFDALDRAFEAHLASL